MVVLFHAQIPGIAGGFLGVDIFLVISGYLITGMIARGVERGDFGFGTFFLTRAKRLLPAAYTVYLFTGITALWLLSEVEMQRYLDTLIGALTFTANFELWQNASYFTTGAKLNVLLHTWSLSLEEQFYFILPVLLVLTPRRFWFVLIVAGFAISILLCFVVVQSKPVASFYLLPTRAWELLLGAVLALNEHRISATLRYYMVRLSSIALIVILLVPIFLPGQRLGFEHPSLDALLVTVATATIIAGRPSFMNRSGPISGAVYWLGGISYSLYLVHWPIFAFSLNAHLGMTPSLMLNLGFIGISVILAATLHALIERPMHQRDFANKPWRATLVALVATLGVAIVAIGLQGLRDNPRDYTSVFQPNYGLSARCDYSGSFQPQNACQTGDRPTVLVWGDSFAMHLVHALPKSIGTFMQATMASCAPAIGIAQFNSDTGLTREWAERCIAFNDAVMRYLDEHPEIQTVILSSVYNQVLDPENVGISRDANKNSTIEFDYQVGLRHFEQTIARLHESERLVILIGPTPTIGVNLAACVERREMGLLTLSKHSDCAISRESAKEYRSSVFTMFEELRRKTGVETIDIFDIFCDAIRCRPVRDKIILFRDAGHISVEGAEYIRANNLLTLP